MDEVLDMQAQTALLCELEGSFRHSGAARRNAIVGKIVELFVRDAEVYSAQQIDLFGEVLTRLIEEIETAARADLSRSISGLRTGPQGLLRALAMDEKIDVARPVLTGSVAVSDDILIECARSRGQQHLLAISQRPLLSASVTEPLIERGDDDVLRSVVGNSGASLSNRGYTALVLHADGNDDLTRAIATRVDLPRHHFLRLLCIASDVVRRELQSAYPQSIGVIHTTVRHVTDAVAARSIVDADPYLEAMAEVRDLDDSGQLGDRTILNFVQQGKVEYAIVALAVLSRLDIDKVEAMLREERFEALLMLARALGLGWPTAKALLNLQAGIVGLSKAQVERALATFERTDRTTAEKVLELKRRRKRHSSS